MVENCIIYNIKKIQEKNKIILDSGSGSRSNFLDTMDQDLGLSPIKKLRSRSESI